MTRRPVIPIKAHSDLSAESGPSDGTDRRHDQGGSHKPVDRRDFLKIMAASAALASAGCSGPPPEAIVPYVRMPEMQVPGSPLFYATALSRHGYAQGVLVESNMGRPTKVEGNPHHPASLGATDAFAQASVLQLWDPDRSRTVYRGNALSNWQAFEGELLRQRSSWDADGGKGLRILSDDIASPTATEQIRALLHRYPKARWHAYDPLHDERALEGALTAFGQPLETLFRLDRATAVLTLDADIFHAWPGSIPYARAFLAGRRSGATHFNKRLYALEATPSLTGSMADNRLALPPALIELLLWRVAAKLGLPAVPADLPPLSHPEAEKWEKALASMLSLHRGRALIVAGGAISAPSRALVHLMNAQLGNAGQTVVYLAPARQGRESHIHSISQLSADMQAGTVKALAILGANPVYTAPADLDFGQALANVPFSVHLGLYRDETGRSATWHLPQTHAFEHWSDGRAYDGTASIVQPLIAPLYDGRSTHHVLSLLSGDNERSGHALVRRHWGEEAGRDFAEFWERSLQRGVIDGTASAPAPARVSGSVTPPSFAADGLVSLFVSDPSVDDGEFANNAWLQELPRPLTTLTWDNAALLSEGTAAKLGVATGDVLKISLQDRPGLTVDAPVWILPGHADGAISLPLGYGRQAAGEVGNHVGFNAYRLRAAASAQAPTILSVATTGRRHEFAPRQTQAMMEGREVVRTASVQEFRRNPGFATDEPKKQAPGKSLYPEWSYPDYKWGMAIDLNACIGCGTCTIACQAENNIPVVGKEQVRLGREMHWIRVDRYYTGDAGTNAAKRPVFQPVPCMHCETAPCEEVCPVGATVHDSDGLNVQVYNRCIGTRFCSNNCPYKVRRFNFLQYADTTEESLKAGRNPEVTVRRRGVMEKCTYCLQRVTRARLDAEKQGRRIRDGEVVTACQAACPTEAIVFGDLNDPGSRVNQAKASPLDYALLSELNTRPRTSYAARLFNPDPALE